MYRLHSSCPSVRAVQHTTNHTISRHRVSVHYPVWLITVHPYGTLHIPTSRKKGTILDDDRGHLFFVSLIFILVKERAVAELWVSCCCWIKKRRWKKSYRLLEIFLGEIWNRARAKQRPHSTAGIRHQAYVLLGGERCKEKCEYEK